MEWLYSIALSSHLFLQFFSPSFNTSFNRSSISLFSIHSCILFVSLFNLNLSLHLSSPPFTSRDAVFIEVNRSSSFLQKYTLNHRVILFSNLCLSISSEMVYSVYMNRRSPYSMSPLSSFNLLLLPMDYLLIHCSCLFLNEGSCHSCILSCSQCS